jgi:hypothetical protein
VSALPFLFAALQAGVPVLPGSTPEAAVMATRADYRQWPSAYDWYLDTPQLVLSKGLAGSAVLRCKVNDFGDLARCKVHTQDPRGYGFGKAAMKLRTKIKMTPTPKGQERWVLVPFRWGEQGPYLAPGLW